MGALLAGGGAALAPVPIFLLALLLARGLPAILYRPQVDTRGVLAAALLQATSLPFIVATTGMGLGILSPATGAALVVAGLLSVVLFPLDALTLLRSKEPAVEQASGYRHQVHRDGTHHSRTSGCIRGFPHSRE